MPLSPPPYSAAEAWQKDLGPGRARGHHRVHGEQERAFAMCRQLAGTEGIFAGGSTGLMAVGVIGEDLRGKRNPGAVQVLYGGPKGLTARHQVWHQGKKGVLRADRAGAISLVLRSHGVVGLRR
jgi:hypothetical protein